MSMPKKHFEKLAYMLHKAYQRAATGGEKRRPGILQNDIECMCTQENALFNTERFRKRIEELGR